MSSRTIRCAFLLMTGALSILAHAADPEVDWDKLKSTAARYLEVCVPANDRAKMKKSMHDRVVQRDADSGVGEEQAAREIMFDWAADNRDNLKRHEPKAVAQVCFYFVDFMDRGFLISSQIRKSLTPSLVQKILDFLQEEIKKKDK